MKPTLLILAAGIGSRYGGLKQLDPIGPSGETIPDYSIYDALQAGFGKVIFVIRESFEKDFRDFFFDKLSRHIETGYVFQEIEPVPGGISFSRERSKPWGTAHAVLMARERISGPFAVINADDFYGRSAYAAVAGFYDGWSPAREDHYCMVGYDIANTLSEHGTVSRGICKTGEGSLLREVTERTRIERLPEGVAWRDENNKPVYIPDNTVVSMNFWGFTPAFFGQIETGFTEFLRRHGQDPKAEFYIPTLVNDLIRERKASVKILGSRDSWFGMTYREDRERVVRNIRELVTQGIYPERLWE